MISLQHRCNSLPDDFWVRDGVRERFEVVDEVWELCRNEEVEGVDGVVWREPEHEDGVGNGLWTLRRAKTGVTAEACIRLWLLGCVGGSVEDCGVEFGGWGSEPANDGVKGEGEWLEAEPGENVKTDGLVLRDEKNKGGGFWRGWVSFFREVQTDVPAKVSRKVNRWTRHIL